MGVGCLGDRYVMKAPNIFPRNGATSHVHERISALLKRTYLTVYYSCPIPMTIV